MKLTYIYHSCFSIEDDAFTILIDYYKDSSDDLRKGIVHQYLLTRPGKIYVMCSHSHADHFNPEILEWRAQRPDIQYIFSKDILDCGKALKEDAFFLDKSDVYKDDLLNIRAFGSTDIGISFLIEVEGKRIFHAGDLNNWHWNEEATEQESREYEQNFLDELEVLAKYTDYLDLVMFPVDPRLGKDYMRGPKQFINRIKTGMLAPMHFGEDYIKASAFKSYAGINGCRFASLSFRGESFEF